MSVSSTNGNPEREILFRCKLCPRETQLFTNTEKEVHKLAHGGNCYFESTTRPRAPIAIAVLTLPPSSPIIQSGPSLLLTSSGPAVTLPIPPFSTLTAPPQRVSSDLNISPVTQPQTQTSNFRVPIPGQSGSISVAISVTVHPEGNIGVEASPSVEEASVERPGILRSPRMSARSVSIAENHVQTARRGGRPRGIGARPLAPIQQNSATGNLEDDPSQRQTRSGRGGARGGISR